MTDYHEPRRRARKQKSLILTIDTDSAISESYRNHPYSANALQDTSAKRRPSLAPPTPIIPSPQRQVYQSADPPPSTRGMMKRLLAKPAPVQLSVDTHEDLAQEITLLPPPPPRKDSLVVPQSPNDFDKSIRALDLVGQVDISILPETDLVERTQSRAEHRSPSPTPSSGKRQRNILRRRPSGNTKNSKSTPGTYPSFSPFFFCPPVY